jgi:SAM-dependent methyltransferase
MTQHSTNLEKSQYTWDNIDIDKVRDVSWMAIRRLSRLKHYKFARDGESVITVLFRERYGGEELAHMRGLALVCGDMASERFYFESQPGVSFDSVDGYDLSRESIQRFRTESFAFTGHVVDVNDIVLPAEHFDFIVGSHGIHHVYNLGGLFYQAHKALKPKGMLFLEEWIGPPYLQIPFVNKVVSTALLLLLFPSRAERTTHDGRVKGVWLQYGREAFDPSEACNSSEILPQLEKYFVPLRMVKYGGLCYPMFEGLGHKFDQTSFLNRFRFGLVCLIERLLTKARIIRPLFITALVEKRAKI